MRNRNICFCLALAVLLLGAPAPSAGAQGTRTTAIGTVLTIQPVEPLQPGAHPTVVVRLVTGAGVPVDDQPIELFLDEARQRRTRTDRTGTAVFTIQRNLVAGAYTLRAVYNGSQTLAPSNATSSLQVEPWELKVRTIPPLAGVPFALDGRRFNSGADGIARISVDRVAIYRLEILATEANQPDIRWTFARWESDVFIPFRHLQLPSERSIEVGFNVSYRVQPAFVDLAGHPVDPGRITTFTLKNSVGGLSTFDNGQPQWLQANRVLRRLQGIEEVKILYSVESVIVDKSNIVNQSQQRFYVGPDGVWPIHLLLFATRFSARDTLFGFPIGAGVRLEYPDGRVQEIPFGPDADVTVRSLVRGIYRASVAGAPGIAPVSPVAQSRDQEVRLLVISYVDLAIVGLFTVVLVLGLLFAGRPQLFTALRHPRSLFVSALHTGADLRDLLRKRAPWRRRRASHTSETISVLQPRAEVIDSHTEMVSTAAEVMSQAAASSETAPAAGAEMVHTYLPAMRQGRGSVLLFAGALVGLGLIGGVIGLDTRTLSPGTAGPPLVSSSVDRGALPVLQMLMVFAIGLTVLMFHARLSRFTPALVVLARQHWRQQRRFLVERWKARSISPEPMVKERDCMSDDQFSNPGTNGQETRDLVTPTTIEQVIERIGGRYIADLQLLSEELSRFYEAQLTAKDGQLQELRQRLAAAEHERDMYTDQIRQLKQASAKHIADLESLRADLSRQFETVVHEPEDS